MNEEIKLSNKQQRIVNLIAIFFIVLGSFSIVNILVSEIFLKHYLTCRFHFRAIGIIF